MRDKIPEAGCVEANAESGEYINLREGILRALPAIIKYRSRESGAHVRRTIMFTEILIEELLKGEYKSELERIDTKAVTKAVALHDIGKVGIPDCVLLKPGRLTKDEYELIKTHTLIGGNIIDAVSGDALSGDIYFKRCREVCLYHHERWDGTGYPDGLFKTEIPLSARVLSVADVYDALVSDRCYKPACSHGVAVDTIKQGSGTQFDPVVVDAFINANSRFYMAQSSH